MVSLIASFALVEFIFLGLTVGVWLMGLPFVLAGIIGYGVTFVSGRFVVRLCCRILD